MTARAVPAGVLILLLAPGLVRGQEPVARLRSKIEDRLVVTSKVSGRLLVGVLAAPEGAGPPSLSVFAQTDEPGHLICVNVVTSNGLYHSGDVEYELPVTRTFGPIRLPYAQAPHFDYVAKRGPDEVAVLARLGSCKSESGPPLIAAWRPPPQEPTRTRVAVITGGRDTTVSVRTESGAWSEARECRRLTGVTTAYDALCVIDAAPDAAQFRVKVQSYSPLGTPLNPPLEFDVVRRTSTAK